MENLFDFYKFIFEQLPLKLYHNKKKQSITGIDCFGCFAELLDCCDVCAETYERKREHVTTRHKQYMRGKKSERERQIARAFIEDVSFESIYNRDCGVCQICGLPVHPTKGVDNSWDGTIDHIVPLSVGGEHSMANCQLAHRICNSIKCQASTEFKINWTEKATENNYWKAKFQRYVELMNEAPA